MAGWDGKGSDSTWRRLRPLVIARDGFRCGTCGVAVHPNRCRRSGCPRCLHVGHRIDKADGGTNHPDNCFVQCQLCNLRAAARRTNTRRLRQQQRQPAMPEWRAQSAYNDWFGTEVPGRMAGAKRR